MTWYCVEERTKPVSELGRIQRKLLFGDIYCNAQSLIQQKQSNTQPKVRIQPSSYLQFVIETADSLLAAELLFAYLLENKNRVISSRVVSNIKSTHALNFRSCRL